MYMYWTLNNAPGDMLSTLHWLPSQHFCEVTTTVVISILGMEKLRQKEMEICSSSFSYKILEAEFKLES